MRTIWVPIYVKMVLLMACTNRVKWAVKLCLNIGTTCNMPRVEVYPMVSCHVCNFETKIKNHFSVGLLLSSVPFYHVWGMCHVFTTVCFSQCELLIVCQFRLFTSMVNSQAGWVYNLLVYFQRSLECEKYFIFIIWFQNWNVKITARPSRMSFAPPIFPLKKRVDPDPLGRDMGPIEYSIELI